MFLLGRGQAVKAPDFDSGIRRFESYRPSHMRYDCDSNRVNRLRLAVGGEPKRFDGARSAENDAYASARRARTKSESSYRPSHINQAVVKASACFYFLCPTSVER
jgi:hypothetical protein